MSFNVTWHIEKQVINLKVFGVVTSEDIIALNLKTMAYIEAGTHPVHLIIDTLDVTEYPTNLRWVLRLLKNNPIPPTGWNILVQNNPTIRVLAGSILSVLHVPLHVCNSLEEAEAFLAAHVLAKAS
ncbi:MAG: hypothetical protein GC204_19330 [Chloroflexi bacterium]|nr:hypothetical protein [Chloroflexota bacterium]